MKHMHCPLSRALAAACLLGALAVPAAALTWDQVLARAQEQNPLLKKADLELRQARMSYRSSYSPFLPNVTANAGADQSDSDAAGFGRSFSYGVSGSWSLFAGFTDIAQARAAGCEQQIAAARHQRARADVRYALRRDYVNLLWAQGAVQLSEDILKRRTENARMIELKYAAGSEDKGALLRVRADSAQAAYDLAKARRALATAQAQLARTIGMDTVASAEGTLEVPTAGTAAVTDLLLRQLPEYRIADYGVIKAHLAASAARGTLYPSLSLSASAGRTGDAWTPENGRWNAGLSLAYPLFTGGRNHYTRAIAEAEVSITEQALAQTARDLDMKLRQSADALADAAEAVAVQELRAAAAAEQSAITTTKYMNGLSSYQDWYVIENDYISGRKSLLNAQRDAALAAAQWENNLGSGDLK